MTCCLNPPIVSCMEFCGTSSSFRQDFRSHFSVCRSYWCFPYLLVKLQLNFVSSVFFRMKGKEGGGNMETALAQLLSLRMPDSKAIKLLDEIRR